MRVVFLLTLVIFCLLSAVWAYQMNYDTRGKQKEIEILNQKIISLTNRIELLKAEWAFLNSPERLSNLVDKHFVNLKLIPISKDKIIYDSNSIIINQEIDNGE